MDAAYWRMKPSCVRAIEPPAFLLLRPCDPIDTKLIDTLLTGYKKQEDNHLARTGFSSN